MKILTHPDGPDLDFSECEREPIRTPNLVQPHGALLVLAGDDLQIRQASLTIEWALGVTAQQAVGKSFAAVAGETAAARVRERLASLPPGDGQHGLLLLDTLPRGVHFAATLHRLGPKVVLELEPQVETSLNSDTGQAAPRIERRLADLNNVFDIAHALAEATAAVTGYHRVMVYRFLPNWSGEVIAEIKRPEAQPFLGLRFPATDIPRSARELYGSKLVRTIVEVGGRPSPIHPAADPPGGEPLDMSWCVLRAASPIHLQYLRNMGVAATLVASLMVDGRLWGLISCHHDTPFAIAPEVRQAMAEIATAGARRLETIGLVQAEAREQRLAARLKAVRAAIAAQADLLPALLFEEPGLMDIALADGVALFSDGRALTIGQTPTIDEIEPLIRAVAASVPEKDDLLILESLERVYPPAKAFRDSACGVIALVISRQPLTVLAAFRTELVREVLWGGDPRQPAVVDAGGRYLSPRTSFEQWRERVEGHCPSWEVEAVEGMRRLRALLLELRGDLGRVGAQLDRTLRAVEPTAESMARLGRALMNAIDSGVLITKRRAGDNDSHVVDLNRPIRWSLGLTHEEARGLPVEALMRRIGAPPELAALPVGGRQEIVLVSDTVGRRVFAVHRRALVKLKTDTLDESLSAWFFTDITRHRRAEDALRAAHDRAMVSNRAKSDYLANLSHELRTPLNTILGFADLMVAEIFGPLDNEQYRSYIADIRSAGEHLLHLINSVLDISKIEAGRLDLEDGEVAIDDVVTESCRMLEEHARRKRLTLDSTIGGGAPVIRADRRAVSQILINLLTNAIKFTPNGGRVWVGVAVLEDSRVQIEVGDTGIGIAPEEQLRVFEPFHQVGSTYNRGGGTGLGLALVKALTQMHGAEVTLTSAVATGTTVRVTFPASRTVVALPPAPVPPH